MKKLVLILFVITLGGGFVMAQESELVPLVKPEVNPSYIMFKKTVTRRMDLMEKQNKSFFSMNGEIPTLLLEAVEDGLIVPYTSDSCNVVMDDETFQDHIRVENEGGGGGFGGGGFGGGGFGGGFGGEQQAEPTDNFLEIPAVTFTVLYLKEDVIFDRNRSRMYNYIRSVGLYMPSNANSTYNPQGIEEPVAFFKYEDLLNLFRGPYVSRAKWYNNQNQAAHINFADAFELRLFRAPIIKISNAEDRDIRQLFGDKIAENPLNAVIIQQQYEYDLMEYESELWEY
jgi:gliding motility associated protien GldN